MNISYYTQFNNEEPAPISGEALTNSKKVQNVRIFAGTARLDIDLGSGYSLCVEPGPPVKATFRTVIGRLR